MTEPIWPQNSDISLLIRTDYSHPQEWTRMKAAIAEPQTDDGFLPNVELLDDRAFEGFPLSRLLDTAPETPWHPVAFLVDTLSLTHPELPILAINLNNDDEEEDEPGEGSPFGATFRVVPSELWSVQNNLSIANMNWEEFAETVDQDGIFRGFP
ncbi:DUF6924 domain-containing protein [Symbioplanes lichenis]|uniref:DUF6924 domain-containing protein n=1 Tax=Symbioplanes lichenis TaxID=1629072 RepID=UPI002738474C|nr:hypothetical protein [Actinoplanes lichenis]